MVTHGYVSIKREKLYGLGGLWLQDQGHESRMSMKIGNNFVLKDGRKHEHGKCYKSNSGVLYAKIERERRQRKNEGERE